MTALSEQLRPGGRVASAVGGADEEEFAKRGVSAANVVTWLTSEQLAKLARWLEDGTLQLPEIHPLPLGEAADALARIGTKHTRGKLVLTVP